MLRVEAVVKSFEDFLAVNEASLAVQKGEIVAVIGPNGAGKTTLFNLITGHLRRDRGRILFKGEDIGALPPHEICQWGIAKTSQMTQPFQEMTIRENLLIPALYGRKLGMKEAGREADSVLDFIGLVEMQNLSAAEIPLSLRRRLELGRLLASGAELLLIDEVMAGLNPTEVEEAIDLLRRIVAGGKTIILVEHIMQAIMKISRRIIVLNHGEKIAEGDPDAVTRNPEVIRAYLGAQDA